MPNESDLSAVVILLSACVGLLFFLLLAVFALRGQLGRIERLLAVKKEASASPAAPPAEEVEPGGPFEEFLNADPARKLLSKKEQSAAYRKWRRENGMNWSNS